MAQKAAVVHCFLDGRFNDPLKIERLSKWCKDATEQTNTKWNYLYVMQEDWDKLEETPNTFSKIIDYFGNHNG